MIRLSDKLYESLLDDESELVNNDKEALEAIFYDECRMFMSSTWEDYIKKNCSFKNGKIYLKGIVNITTEDISPDLYDKYIFRGFSVSSNIQLLHWLATAESNSQYQNWNFDPKIHKISKINRYPMHIKQIDSFWLEHFDIFDYCSNIKIDNVDSLNIQLETNNLYELDFNFFKCIKNIKELDIFCRYRNNKYGEITPGLIKNINAETVTIDLKLIDNTARSVTSIKKDKLNDFLSDLENNNKIKNIIIRTYPARTNKNVRYTVDKTGSGYKLTQIKSDY